MIEVIVCRTVVSVEGATVIKTVVGLRTGQVSPPAPGPANGLLGP